MQNYSFKIAICRMKTNVIHNNNAMIQTSPKTNQSNAKFYHKYIFNLDFLERKQRSYIWNMLTSLLMNLKYSTMPNGLYYNWCQGLQLYFLSMSRSPPTRKLCSDCNLFEAFMCILWKWWNINDLTMHLIRWWCFFWRHKNKSWIRHRAGQVAHYPAPSFDRSWMERPMD